MREDLGGFAVAGEGERAREVVAGDRVLGVAHDELAQRGGSVTTHLKMGEFESPLICEGDADLQRWGAARDPLIRLAQAIARATGESMTRVVTEALRERYAKIEQRKGKASVQELLAIADRAAALVQRPYLDHAELLYDENGLPR